MPAVRLDGIRVDSAEPAVGVAAAQCWRGCMRMCQRHAFTVGARCKCTKGR